MSCCNTREFISKTPSPARALPQRKLKPGGTRLVIIDRYTIIKLYLSVDTISLNYASSAICMLHTLTCCCDNSCGGYPTDIVVSPVAIATSNARTHTQKYDNDDNQPKSKNNQLSVKFNGQLDTIRLCGGIGFVEYYPDSFMRPFIRIFILFYALKSWDY